MCVLFRLFFFGGGDFLSRVIPGTPKDMGPPYGKRDPYHSHIFRDSYGSGMGIVWEAYHKGVPLLGVPENPIDPLKISLFSASS